MTITYFFEHVGGELIIILKEKESCSDPTNTYPFKDYGLNRLLQTTMTRPPKTWANLLHSQRAGKAP